MQSSREFQRKKGMAVLNMHIWNTIACLSAGLTFFVMSSAAQASPIVVGTDQGGNCFPFGCDGGTRYQQVYAASNFSGAIEITGISFYGEGTVTTADYTITFSTSNFTVNNLNVVDLDANPGADATLFAIQNLAGPTGGQFTINAGAGGGSSFYYDPTDGDLLVDIELTNIVAGTGGAYLDAMSTSGGLFSRAHNFGSAFDNYGLVTGFNIQPVAVTEPGTLAILGFAFAGLGAIGRRRLAGRVRTGA